MKFLILFVVVAAASAVPSYGSDIGTGGNYDYRTLMMGGRSTILDKDITIIKKDFIVFYYKYLIDLMDILKTRFSDMLMHIDFKDIDIMSMPMYCNKITGLMRWMMIMNIDFTKYDIHFFDMFMMCKITDYMMFMKYYWLNFNYVDVMHKDMGMMQDIYTGVGGHDTILNQIGLKYGIDKAIPDKIIGEKSIRDRIIDIINDEIIKNGITGDKIIGDGIIDQKNQPIIEEKIKKDKIKRGKIIGDGIIGEKYW